ncbi:MAG: putative PEP-binding protein [Planktomarina sp.]
MLDRSDFAPIVEITQTAAMASDAYGVRAKCLQRLIRLDMPVPTTVALSFEAVLDVAQGGRVDLDAILKPFGKAPLLSVRPSSQDAQWGGPGAVLNIGMNDASFRLLKKKLGEASAATLYLNFIHSFAVHVARLDGDMFDLEDAPTWKAVKAALADYEHEADEPFPQDIGDQLTAVIRSMARVWDSTTARLLRQAKGAPADAGLGLVVQEMALGVGKGESGAGVVQFANAQTGAAEISGTYMRGGDALCIAKTAGQVSLEEAAPDVFAQLMAYGDLARTRLREEMEIEFTLQEGALAILDAVKITRSSRASVRIAVDLAKDGVISVDDALMRVQPKTLSELLHRQVMPDAKRTVLAHGIAASPGAAVGRVVFTTRDAQALAAKDEPAILVRRETGPEDIRGMQAAVAVVTERGGVTSHAAVIGRGMGLPCVVGATDLAVDVKAKTITGSAGQIIHEGDVLTIDGTKGEILMGEVQTQEASLGECVKTLLSWADERRALRIRANADTPRDVTTALNFKADGIGLCRSEHMFFEADRLTVMREMIFAESPQDRSAALARLLPMQRKDFTKIFQIMEGRPVTIRLLDPPLHEFLPSGKAGLRDLAEALGLPVSEVTARVEQLSEFNPMLGLRGIRLGITVPEIYDMQARAIFEAALAADNGAVPEIMLPLVSAKREVELVKTRIDATAAAVRVETGKAFEYSVGVMVETPRAALRANEIAPHCSFLSFGTNDLTQMTYGLSRDDAGRFMSAYVQQGVYAEDPFFRLDTEGVGELLEIASARGRDANPKLTMAICGEHGGDPETMDFLHDLGIAYISCSPFRVPVARLAASQSQINRGKVD